MRRRGWPGRRASAFASGPRRDGDVPGPAHPACRTRERSRSDAVVLEAQQFEVRHELARTAVSASSSRGALGDLGRWRSCRRAPGAPSALASTGSQARDPMLEVGDRRWRWSTHGGRDRARPTRCRSRPARRIARPPRIGRSRSCESTRRMFHAAPLRRSRASTHRREHSPTCRHDAVRRIEPCCHRQQRTSRRDRRSRRRHRRGRRRRRRWRRPTSRYASRRRRSAARRRLPELRNRAVW